MLQYKACHKVSLHIILIGVIGTIYKYHIELPFSKLGLDRRCVVKNSKLTLYTSFNLICSKN